MLRSSNRHHVRHDTLTHLSPLTSHPLSLTSQLSPLTLTSHLPHLTLTLTITYPLHAHTYKTHTNFETDSCGHMQVHRQTDSHTHTHATFPPTVIQTRSYAHAHTHAHFARAEEDKLSPEEFVAFVGTINDKLKELQMKISSVRSQATSITHWALVNQVYIKYKHASEHSASTSSCTHIHTCDHMFHQHSVTCPCVHCYSHPRHFCFCFSLSG